jgi:hypothetical protein
MATEVLKMTEVRIQVVRKHSMQKRGKGSGTNLESVFTKLSGKGVG